MDELFNISDFILNNQDEIEKHIDYHFGSQTKLLIQAFTRKTFAKENEGYAVFFEPDVDFVKSDKKENLL